jgi:serine/threonine-protein kinase
MADLPKTIGRYVIDSQLGRGSMGVVYKAHDPEIDRPVAVKLVRMDLLETHNRDDYLARFRREVQAAGRCMHPGIVAIYDFGFHEGEPFFVMEYVDGAPLDQTLPKGAGIGPDAAVDIVLQVLNALAAAHALGVVHRDVKPANMLMTSGRRIKVMDFGISKVSTSHMTQAGAVMGTPRYMSPEQIRGEEVDARTDIFSTGAVLHELLVGRTPFTGPGLEAVMAKLLYEDADIAPESASMPAALRAVVAKAIAKPAGERYQTAEAMATALRQAMGGAAAPQPSAAETVMMSRPPPAPPPPERDPTLSDATLLASIERRLAQYMGPIAGRLMRKALETAATPEGLCEALAANIDAPAERERFLADVRARIAAGGTLGTAGTGVRGARAAALTAADIEKVERDLTRFLGPIAKVLVRRASASVTTEAALREALAGHIERPGERTQFLSGG